MTNLQDIAIFRLRSEHASELSVSLLADPDDYRQYFIPFSFESDSLHQRLESARQDRYWGVRCGDVLAGFFMLRGFDEGYKRPAYGVYITQSFAGKGLASLTLRYCISWCRINNVEALMLKVHPDNTPARTIYEREGFRFLEIDPRTGHHVMELRW